MSQSFDEWMVEVLARLGAEFDCLSGHVHTADDGENHDEWIAAALHLRGIYNHVKDVAQTIIKRKLTQADINAMMAAELQALLEVHGIPIPEGGVIVTNDLQMFMDGIRGVDDDELRRFVESGQTKPTTETGGGKTEEGTRRAGENGEDDST